MSVCSLILLTSFSYAQSSEEIIEIKNQAKITLDAYINYLSYIGDKNEDFADRNQSYRKAFYQSFYSTSDETICYNDLDPEEKTSVYSSAKDYTDHVLHWYNQGLSTRFIGEPQFGKVAIANGVNYIPVVVKKEVRGNYMERRIQNKQYDLEFRLAYTRSSMGSISNVKIASIKPASGGNNFKENDNNSVSAEELFKQAKAFYNQKDYAEALKLYRKASEKGNTDAQNNIGDLYLFGYGVISDYVEAIKWYQKAAEKGNVDAQNNLGFMYENGYGVTENISTSIEWYQKAAKQNSEAAQKALARLEGYKENNNNFISNDPSIKEVSVRTEDNNSIKEVSVKKEDNNNNSASAKEIYKQANKLYAQKDYKKAFPIMKEAAERGNIDAQKILGDMYLLEYGIAKDNKEAVKWYQKAAQKEHSEAQDMLGFMYQYGSGVIRDISTAVEWYRKAAKQNNKSAQKALKKLGYNW
jgi:TPR repeat protein